MDPIMQEETRQLAQKLELYEMALCDARLHYESLPSLYRGDPDLLGVLMLQMHNHIARLERGKGKPYFARIDFAQDGPDGMSEQCYIGKIGVSDSENRLVTVDWRAPVATLYYDSSVGPAEYEAPGGVIKGELSLKRQIEVEDGELRSVSDVDTVSNDDLLRPYLGVNADNRLKNIVASIQGEQNRIIREKLQRNLIVQGAAGSGKTTVALHRIAYLAYTYRDTVRSSQYMVIGPNPFFIRYISSVLPDLDVDSVPQDTFEGLARAYIKEGFLLADRARTLRDVLDGKTRGEIERYKTSMRYKQDAARFLDAFEQSILPDGDFAIRGFTVLTAQETADAYAGARVTREGTISARVQRCILMLSSLIQSRYGLLEGRVSAFFREKYAGAADAGELESLHRDRKFIETELEKGCQRSLKNFFSRVDVKVLTLYRQFLQSFEAYHDGSFAQAAKLQKDTLSLLRKKTLTPEDLAAVMYIKERVQGAGSYEDIRHTIVDEAQDYGEFELYALRRVLCGSTFTIVGDLAQSIFSYRSVESWEPVLRHVFPGQAQLCQMQKSYRTTVEIMQAANAVTERLGLPRAQAVIRHGEPVRLHPVTREGQAKAIAEQISLYRQMGFSTIAVISKLRQESDGILSSLRACGIQALPIDDDSEGLQSGVYTVTAYQAKGLEFDAAILSDVSCGAYRDEDRTDQHLLYVAMTRPLHRLDLFCTGRPAAALAGLSAQG